VKANPSLLPEQEPLEIKRGNVTVKVYRGTNRVKDKATGAFKDYPQFTLVYYSGSERIKKRFADLDDATREAELTATKLATGENEVLKLTSVDRSSYIQACGLLKPLEISLYRAVDEYVQAAKRLPQGTSLKEAVDFFVRRNHASLPKRTVKEVVEEMVAAKTEAGRSDLHVDDIESRLGRFAKAFEMPIAQVTGDMIQKHIYGLELAGRTRRNHLRHITSLFRFAVRRHYLHKDALEELAAVEAPEVLPTETLIFSPGELREMLSAVRTELVPWVAIAAFCGLRTAEIMRLDWGQVNLEQRFIEVKAISAKTASRRTVPLCEAAVAWITPHRKQEGRVAYFAEDNKFCEAVVFDVNGARKEAGAEAEKNGDTALLIKLGELKPFAWKKNGLRHSFCSYRLALTKNASATSFEAGNSPSMIFKHYWKLVTEDEAKAWFEVTSTTQENMIALPALGAAA
jgi:integrase